jgi:glycosyl transferase family 2
LTKRITVGLPVYRAAPHMTRALTCLQEQTFADFDAIISVDGNDQETADACRPFLSDPRFRMIVHPKRLDWFGNLNWLLQQDMNEFFCYRQHDDTTSPEFFEKLLKVADATLNVAAVYCDCQWTGGRNDLEVAPSIEGDPLGRLLQYLEQLQPVAVRGLIRRDAIRQAGLVRSDEFRALCGVFVWLAKVLRWGSFKRLPEPLYFRLDHTDNYHKDYKTWPEQRLRAAWTTMFTGMLEAIIPVCNTPEERLYVQQIVLDRVTMFRQGRPYIYVPGSPDSAGKFIAECLERLMQEGNMHLLDIRELPTVLQSQFRAEASFIPRREHIAGVEKLRRQADLAEHEWWRTEGEVTRFARSPIRRLGRRVRRMLGRLAAD